jgi:hypothetical protein
VIFDITDEILIRLLYLSGAEEKWEYNETVHQLFIDFKKLMNVVRPINMYFNERYGNVNTGKYLSDNFPVKMI